MQTGGGGQVSTMDVDDAIELELKVRELVTEIEARLEHGDATVKPPGKLGGTEGRLSRQDSMLHHEMAKAGLRRQRERLAALESALLRMDEGSYGFCARCDDEIELERLQEQPEALLCQACARKVQG